MTRSAFIVIIVFVFFRILIHPTFRFLTLASAKENAPHEPKNARKGFVSVSNQIRKTPHLDFGRN